MPPHALLTYPPPTPQPAAQLRIEIGKIPQSLSPGLSPTFLLRSGNVELIIFCAQSPEIINL